MSGGGRSGDKKPMKPMTLPPQLLKFKNLQILHIEGLLESLPENIDSLQNLQFISIPHNPNMTSLPASLANLPNLEVLNIRGNNIEIPPALEEKWNNGEIVIVK